MDVRGKIVVVTGGARGIGAALTRRFAAEGAAAIAIADLDLEAAERLATELALKGIKSLSLGVDVSEEAQVRAMIARTEDELGPIDLMCSNAGIYLARTGQASDADWAKSWSVNVMSNVYVARAILPRMVARGRGYILMTCSAAGMLANADATYMVSKHAALAFAEWMAIHYRAFGLKVSALCPLGVRTEMLTKPMAEGNAAVAGVVAGGRLLEPEQIADAVICGLAAERFLILPHEEVRERIVQKATDRDAWLTAMEQQFSIGVPSLAEHSASGAAQGG